jgi:hypothetical protein
MLSYIFNRNIKNTELKKPSSLNKMKVVLWCLDWKINWIQKKQKLFFKSPGNHYLLANYLDQWNLIPNWFHENYLDWVSLIIAIVSESRFTSLMNSDLEKEKYSTLQTFYFQKSYFWKQLYLGSFNIHCKGFKSSIKMFINKPV